MPDIEALLRRKQVRDKVMACRECSLCDVGSGPIPFSGPSPCDVAIVGEAPGADEDKEKAPFVGQAGRLLRGYLRHNSLDGDVAYVNTVSCYPNRTPTAREVRACEDNLASQLLLLRPRFVLLVGGIALSAFWPGERITDVRGNWWSAPLIPEHANVHILATWHPAAVLRNNDLSDDFRVDIEDFAEVVHGEQPFKKYWCTKCNHEAKHWRNPHGGRLGVPYCDSCYNSTVGVRLPKSTRTKTSNKNRSKTTSLL